MQNAINSDVIIADTPPPRICNAVNAVPDYFWRAPARSDWNAASPINFRAQKSPDWTATDSNNNTNLERELAAIRAGETDIIIGTQLIAKGHDFARVTLVGVVDSDQGLYSVDFRAPEYLFQQLVQVAGRAGRDKSPGEVLIQTAHPDNRTLQFLRRHDFAQFADECIAERRAAAYPPFAHLALWRAESTQAGSALGFLRYAAGVGRRLLSDNSVTILDAVVSPMEKLAGRYRAQLMVRSGERAKLHALLRAWLAALEADPKSRRARWSLDVDPMEMF